MCIYLVYDATNPPNHLVAAGRFVCLHDVYYYALCMYFPPVPRGNRPGPLYACCHFCGRVTVRNLLEFTVIRSPNEMSTLSVSSVIVN